LSRHLEGVSGWGRRGLVDDSLHLDAADDVCRIGLVGHLVEGDGGVIARLVFFSAARVGVHVVLAEEAVPEGGVVEGLEVADEEEHEDHDLDVRVLELVLLALLGLVRVLRVVEDVADQQEHRQQGV